MTSVTRQWWTREMVHMQFDLMNWKTNVKSNGEEVPLKFIMQKSIIKCLPIYFDSKLHLR